MSGHVAPKSLYYLIFAALMVGTILTNGAVTVAGMRPSATIGSENTMRISLASPSGDSDTHCTPVGRPSA